jgi:hypothetical protein
MAAVSHIAKPCERLLAYRRVGGQRGPRNNASNPGAWRAGWLTK